MCIKVCSGVLCIIQTNTSLNDYSNCSFQYYLEGRNILNRLILGNFII